MPLVFWLTLAGLAVLPDVDVLAFRLGIPYEAPWGHRGFFHSLLFGLIVGGTAGLVLRIPLQVHGWALCALCITVAVSHTLLDACTNGGLGVALLAPFDQRRIFFPWRPIQVSPIGAHFFSLAGLAALTSEVLWVWLPLAAALVIARLCR